VRLEEVAALVCLQARFESRAAPLRWYRPIGLGPVGLHDRARPAALSATRLAGNRRRLLARQTRSSRRRRESKPSVVSCHHSTRSSAESPAQPDRPARDERRKVHEPGFDLAQVDAPAIDLGRGPPASGRPFPAVAGEAGGSPRPPRRGALRRAWRSRPGYGPRRVQLHDPIAQGDHLGTQTAQQEQRLTQLGQHGIGSVDVVEVGMARMVAIPGPGFSDPFGRRAARDSRAAPNSAVATRNSRARALPGVSGLRRPPADRGSGRSRSGRSRAKRSTASRMCPNQGAPPPMTSSTEPPVRQRSSQSELSEYSWTDRVVRQSRISL